MKTLILTATLLLSACGPDPWGTAARCDDTCRQGVAALLNSGALTPPQVHPYILPQPVNYSYHPTITCSTLGSNLTGTISCQ